MPNPTDKAPPSPESAAESPPPDARSDLAQKPDDSGAPLARQGKDAVRLPKEIGGREGPEPTRYGDWEKNGRCIDF